MTLEKHHLIFQIFSCYCKYKGYYNFNPLLHRYSFWRINNRQLLKTFWGIEAITRNEKFLLIPQCFHLNQIIVYPFVHIFDIVT